MNKSLQVIKDYKLDNYLKILITLNEGNNNPYHNLNHTLTVVKNIYDISNNISMEHDKIRLMLIAGIFHDFNHSGGIHKKDSYNILDAITAFNIYSIENDEDNDFIVSVIVSTQFPYDKEKDASLNEYQKIIRDADVIQWVEDDYIQQVILGLGKEIFGTDSITIKQLEGQIDFMRSVKIFSKYAQNIINNKIESKIEDCEYLITILK